ncbi:hypothetical protein B0T11DRAFT_96132 [Plectosphaerella cucumerina]|uniref:Secreted protein n=1 Tax=Plectosphaerella cucumerina TaxID=40658 RepID=A0A8K0TCT0_9PEZI|nr:hypothetical protein B0T11DRAFT_96132 [Plectosphaerella cucumerina]
MLGMLDGLLSLAALVAGQTKEISEATCWLLPISASTPLSRACPSSPWSCGRGPILAVHTGTRCRRPSPSTYCPRPGPRSNSNGRLGSCCS